MVDMIGKARQLTPVDPMRLLKDTADHAGGYMYQGTEGGSSNGPKTPMMAKASLIDGPYGGKVKA